MLKLLRADFFCLRRSRTFWLCAAAAFVLSSVYMLRADTDSMQILDQNLLQVFPFLPILHAAFVSLFLGLEYQDGTMRNKLIVGHSRIHVYLSRLLVSITGCFGILAAWALSILAGAAKFGWFASPVRVLVCNAVVILLLTAALAAILTMLCMLLTNRAVSAVTAILLMFGLLVLASTFYNALCEPETVSAAVVKTASRSVNRCLIRTMSPVRFAPCTSLPWTRCPPDSPSCWPIRSWSIRSSPSPPLPVW